MSHRFARIQIMSILLCIALTLSGCGYIAKNWTKPIGVTEKSKPSSSNQAGVADETTGSAQISLLISEVMSNNVGSLTLPDGTTPDWIELYNSSSRAVSLKGYMLSDNTKKPDKYVFSNGSLEPGAYLLVYASSLDPKASPGFVTTNTIHLPFGLSSAGEELLLTAPDGTAIDQWTIPALPADISFGRNGKDSQAGSAKVYYGKPTPGKTNGTDGKATADAAIVPTVTTLLINEYCTRNASLYDEAGDYPDWIELYNAGTEPIDLSGYTLSDDLAKLDKWQFPKVSIAPKAYLLLLLSGKTADAADAAKPLAEGRLRVDFRLSADDTQIVISDTRGRTVANAAIEALPLNVSKGRLPDNNAAWVYFPRPTPGKANTTISFPALSQANSQASKLLLVSEVFAQDGMNATAPVKDWIELYNCTDQKIDLTGYGLSDNSDLPYQMKLSGLIINPKSTVVIEPQVFAISANGETIMLTDPTGVVEDAYATGYLRSGYSSGRNIGSDATGSLERFFYVTPTKNQPNTSTAYETYTEMPAISVTQEASGAVVDNLYISQSVLVTIKTVQPNAKIYYTINGNRPTTASALYQGPIRVDSSMVVKAIAIRPDCLSSDSVSRTLLKETPHSLPVISLSGNPAELTSPGTSVFSRITSDMEAPAEFAFYEADGQLGIDFQVGVQLHGQYSRKELQQSLEVKMRSSYGDSEVTYPFFKDYDVSTFRRLVLRTSGQDWKFTKVRDAFMTRIVQGQLALDSMAVRNCVLYINGQYYGLFEIREKLDQFYIASHYKADPNQVDMIKGNSMIVAGDNKDYQSLLQYVKTHDMKDPTAYQAVLARVDEESLMDFVIAQSFFSNPDSGNKKFWRLKTDGGQYRWMLFDLDWGMFPSTYTSDRLKGDLLDPAGHGQGEFFSTTLQVKLMENPAFREAFIKRFANFLNTTFKTDRMLKILDESVEIIKSEMPRQIARWGVPGSMGSWNNSVSELRRITTEKRGRMITSLQQNFGLSQAKMKELFPGDFS